MLMPTLMKELRLGGGGGSRGTHGFAGRLQVGGTLLQQVPSIYRCQ